MTGMLPDRDVPVPFIHNFDIYCLQFCIKQFLFMIFTYIVYHKIKIKQTNMLM